LIEINKIYNEDCIDFMNKCDENFVDLTVTSPPYGELRSYTDNIDKTWNSDVWKKVIEGLFKVTKEGGVVVWVVGDETKNGDESGTSFEQALYFKKVGFKLHDTMIYDKGGFSNPSNNRYHQVFEYMFIFVKGKMKTFNPIMDRKTIYNGSLGRIRFGQNRKRQKDGSMIEFVQKNSNKFGMRFNIWRLLTSAQENPCKAIWHPATFSNQLASDHIISWSNEYDLVFDPFSGSGTTAKAAIKLNRKFLGCEISKEYFEKSNEEIRKCLINQPVKLEF
jgi:DNA modification methylase